MQNRWARLLAFVCLAVSVALAQQVAEPDQGPPQDRDTAPIASVPGIHVDVVYRTIEAVDYRTAKPTKIDFRGTSLMPEAKGHAEVASKKGRTAVEAHFERLQKPQTAGFSYLTYVLWAISPNGRPTSLGELHINDDGNGEVKGTTPLQAFGMMVTAEPYFGVTEPSDRVVLQNVPIKKTKGGREPVIARYQVLPRAMYLASNQPIDDRVYGVDENAPLDLLEARNAVRIARNADAEQLAPDTYAKARQLLAQAEDDYSRKQSKSTISTAARQAVQTAEEARVMSVKRTMELEAAARRRAAEQRAENAQQQAALAQQNAAEARAQAETEAQQRQQAQAELDAARQARQQARRQAEQAQVAAQEAEQQRQQALQQQQEAQAEAERARLTAQQAEQQKEQMRARLLQQLNQVLQTRDTAQGLIVNMPDVLFDFNKATLKPAARERLAKVAGIILAYPDLHLKVEGFTDNIGSEEYNQKLSELRAAAVRDFLIQQGVPLNDVTAQGFGKAEPVASNATPEGRQRNRRVDLVVSGTAIGEQVGTAGTSAPATASGTAGTATGVAPNREAQPNNQPSVSNPTQPPR